MKYKVTATNKHGHRAWTAILESRDQVEELIAGNLDNWNMSVERIEMAEKRDNAIAEFDRALTALTDFVSAELLKAENIIDISSKRRKGDN